MWDRGYTTNPLPNTRVGGETTSMNTHPYNSESNVTTHGGNHEGNQAERPQSSGGGSSFRDYGRADSNDRANKDRKGKNLPTTTACPGMMIHPQTILPPPLLPHWTLHWTMIICLQMNTGLMLTHLKTIISIRKLCININAKL